MMQKKKIGILTFHASHNYGSMLQAYALCTAISELNFNVQIINFRSPSQKMMYAKPYKYWDVQAIKGRLLSPSLFIKNIKKWNKYERFMKDYMPLTYEVNNLADIRSVIVENAYDAVITGSDQIWNFHSPDFNIGYFLPFTLSCKKIAYAPSMGHLKWLKPKDVELFLRSTLLDYSALSVREKSLAVELSKLLNKDVVSMPDPAWLVSKNTYDLISYKKPLIKGKYLFYYTPRREYDGANEVYKYAKFNNLKAVCSSSPSLPCPNFINYNDAAPSEFLNFIKNADCVLGNSMHMIIFALLFHVPFILLSDNVDTRMHDLLQLFGLEDRVCTITELNNKKLTDIDWNKVDSRINELRTIAIQWLRSAINN